MQKLMFIAFIVTFTACSSVPEKRGPTSVFGESHGGALEAVYQVSRPQLSGSHLVSHVCTSTPIFNNEGEYQTSVVNCH